MKYKLNTLYNEDCLEAMKYIPDKYFDLAIVDPPYGIGIDGQKEYISKTNSKHNRKANAFYGWDKERPGEEYFRELKRVSKNQIIWGGNYFVEHLPPTKGWLVWDKGQHGLSMSDCELAYTSFNKPTRVVNINRGELAREGTIHPTQKPIKLYAWILSMFADKSYKVLDTHCGSANSLIACHRAGIDFLGFEIQEEYYKAAKARLEAKQAQLRLFDIIRTEGKTDE